MEIPKKTCKYCGKEFTPSRCGDRMLYCSKECRLAARKMDDYNKKYYQANKERFQAERKTQKYRDKRNRYNESRREKYKSDEEYRNFIKNKVKKYNHEHPESKLAQHLKPYGLTIDSYNELLESQNHKCAICGAEIGNAEGDRLYVDHDHITGKVRGLLCSNCNLGIGKFQDNVELLKKAIRYLEGTNGTDRNMVRP